MTKFLLHSLFLVVSVILAFFWTNNPHLSYYNLQLIAVFIIFFFINQVITRHHPHKINRTIDAAIFTMVVLLLVISTGGLNSPLFFLLYFLMFGLSLLFEPLITFSLSITMVLFFLFTPTEKELFKEILQLFSLILITPMAMFFGKQYLKLLRDEEKIKILEEEQNVIEEEIEREETNILLWVSLELKKGLTEILDQTSQLLSDIGHLTVRQKDRLLKISDASKKLLKSGQQLKEEIDKITDEKK